MDVFILLWSRLVQTYCDGADAASIIAFECNAAEFLSHLSAMCRLFYGVPVAVWYDTEPFASRSDDGWKNDPASFGFWSHEEGYTSPLPFGLPSYSAWIKGLPGWIQIPAHYKDSRHLFGYEYPLAPSRKDINSNRSFFLYENA